MRRSEEGEVECAFRLALWKNDLYVPGLISDSCEHDNLYYWQIRSQFAGTVVGDLVAFGRMSVEHWSVLRF